MEWSSWLARQLAARASMIDVFDNRIEFRGEYWFVTLALPRR
jgi:hypothetical protein